MNFVPKRYIYKVSGDDRIFIAIRKYCKLFLTAINLYTSDGKGTPHNIKYSMLGIIVKDLLYK